MDRAFAPTDGNGAASAKGGKAASKPKKELSKA
jgi:hypothetical protein